MTQPDFAPSPLCRTLTLIENQVFGSELPPMDPELNGHRQILGRTAVDAAVHHAEIAALAHRIDLPEDIVAIHRRVVGRHIGDARYELGALSPPDQLRSAELLRLSAMPEALRVMVAGGNDSPHDDATLFQRLLAKKDAVTHEVPDETFLNVVQWHNDRMSEKQQAFDREKTPSMKEEFKAQMSEAVADGWMPSDGWDNMKQRIPDTPLYIDDGSQTDLNNSDGFMDAEHPEHQYAVVLSPDALEAVTHEFVHVLAGVNEDRMPAIPRQRREVTSNGTKENHRHHTGLRRIFGAGPGGKLMDEAIVEHIALSLKDGKVHILDPTNSHRADGSYIKAREVPFALCTAGVVPVDIELFINAYCENGSDREGRGDNSAAATLIRKLHEAFPGRDVISEIANIELNDKKTANQLVYEFALELHTARLETLLQQLRGGTPLAIPQQPGKN